MIKIIKYDKNKYYNSIRIRNKRSNLILDSVALNLDSLNKMIISVTILLKNAQVHVKKTNEFFWMIQLPILIKKYKQFFKNNDNLIISFFSIEMHRNLEDKEDSLKGLPHLHFVLVTDHSNERLNFVNIHDELLDFFKDYDLKINHINRKKSNFLSLKRSFKYIIKEYRINDDVIENLRIYTDLQSPFFYWYNKNYDLLSSQLKEFNNLVENRLNFDIFAKEGELIIDNKIQGLNLIIQLIQRFIRKNNLLKFKTKLYKHDERTDSTYRFFCYLKDIKEHLLSYYIDSEYLDLIFNKIHQIIDIIATGNILQDSSFSFQYIEYKDFYLDLYNQKIIFKNEILVDIDLKNQYIAFKYFPYSFESVRATPCNSIKKMFSQDKWINAPNYFEFVKSFNHILLGQKQKKGNVLFLVGEPNSGKSLITEHLLSYIYGSEEIAILNFSDKKHLTEDIVNKHILVMSEFKYTKIYREFILKLFDGSKIEINRKYKNMLALSSNEIYKIGNTNFDIAKQSNNDPALMTRINEFEVYNHNKENFYEDFFNEIPYFLIECCIINHFHYTKDWMHFCTKCTITFETNYNQNYNMDYNLHLLYNPRKSKIVDSNN